MIGTKTEHEAKSKALALMGLLLAALMAVSFLLIATPAYADDIFVVNRTGDASDKKINGSCDTSPKKRGQQCTLRAAIQEANATIAPDDIRFRIPTNSPGCDAATDVCTISPTSALKITEPSTINGYTQPRSTANTATTGTNAVLKIVINGSKAGTAPGIYVTGSNTTVKGLVVNGFQDTGVILFPDGGQPGGNRLEGSFIGTDVTGTTAVSNGIGVLASGFATGSNPAESKNEVVGGDTLAARNLISGNTTAVETFFGRATLKWNLIGTKSDGITNLGNGIGVRVTGPGSIIEGNTIAHSGFDGVEVSGADGTGNRILSNSIFDNGGPFANNLGIDLLGSNGVTANDTSDGDTGPNNRQNYPVITDATTAVGLGTTIQGTLNSIPSSVTTQTFTIQFFSSPAADPSGFGEGKTFLGETQVQTDAIGNASFTFVPAQKVPVGQFITATATNNATGDTSEFSLTNDVEPPEAQP
jgi:CSLREA domain-containing protein